MNKNSKKRRDNQYNKRKNINHDESREKNNIKTIKTEKNRNNENYNPDAFKIYDQRIRKQIANPVERNKFVSRYSYLNKKTKRQKSPYVFNLEKTKIKKEDNFKIISKKNIKKITFKKNTNSFFSIISEKKDNINIIDQNISYFSLLSTKKDCINRIDQNISDFSIISTKKDDNSIVEQNISDFSILSIKKDDKSVPVKYITDFTILPKKKDDLMIHKSYHFTLEGKIENREVKEEESREKRESEIIRLPDIPKGLNNFSLNCYMNSLLQCLYHIKGLRTSFIDPSKYSKETQKVCYSLSEVMVGLTYGDHKCFSPNDFKDTLGNTNPLFKGHKGADVSDLYRTIVDSIINEIIYEYPEGDDENDDGDNTNQTHNYEMAKKEVDMKNPIIKELNYFFETIYDCPLGYKCYSIQNDTSIMFELLKISKWANTNNLDLKKCFEYNYRIIDKNEFYCSRCDGIHINKSQDKILSLPKILTLILNRGKGKKFVDKVDFDEIINIEKYVDDTFIKNENNTYKYKLIGVSTHLGSSSDFGHYIAYCFRENTNKYYCLNDESYRVVSFNDLKNGDPYLLFYERIDY